MSQPSLREAAEKVCEFCVPSAFTPDQKILVDVITALRSALDREAEAKPAETVNIAKLIEGLETIRDQCCGEAQCKSAARSYLFLARAKSAPVAPDPVRAELATALESLLAAAIHCDPHFENRWSTASEAARAALAKFKGETK
jgi:hypothetical protein